MRFKHLASLCLLLAAFTSFAEAASNNDWVSKAVGASLQGDAKAALQFLEKVDPSELDVKPQKFYQCMIKRFKQQSPAANEKTLTDGSFTAKLSDMYRHYWHNSLLSPNKREQWGDALDRELKERLDLNQSATPIEVDNAIRQKLKAEGHYGLLGQTGSLRELMIWSKEERREELVIMPHGEYKTTVAYLDDFIESGWGQYATCEQRGAGGWVADRTLFAVVPLYDDIEGEEFKVTFLGHETQHFLDLDIYDNMASWELEYRAKLMELSMADKTRSKVLKKFIEDQKDNPSYPHSYANYRLLGDLTDALSLSTTYDLYKVDKEKMKKAAVSLFNSDTASRR